MPPSATLLPWWFLPSTVLLAPLVTGCGDASDASARWSGTIRDSAGITIVENQDVPLWSEGEAWTFTKVVRIGRRDGPPEYQFGMISGFVMLSDGRLAVADMQAHNVRFFSPDGTYLHGFGQKGAGPGEFSGHINLLLGPGDTILAIDSRTAQASRITPDGTWLGSFSTVPVGGYWTRAWDDDEASREIVTLLFPLVGDGAPLDLQTALVVRRDLYGAFLDTVARIPALQSVTESGGGRLQHRYRTYGYFDLCDGMLVTGQSDGHRFIWQRPDGSVERITTLDRERLPLTGAEQDLFLRRADYVAKRRGMSATEAGHWKSMFRFEELYPAWRRFVCGPAGSILVRRIRPLSEFTVEELDLGDRPPGGEWDVFDREGRYLGVAPLPTTPHRHAFSRDADGSWLMMGQEEDDLDVQYIGVWRIEGVNRD